jgi:hypothetical protein
MVRVRVRVRNRVMKKVWVRLKLGFRARWIRRLQHLRPRQLFLSPIQETRPGKTR